MVFGPSAFQLRGQVDQKSSPKLSKINQKIVENLNVIFDRFFVDFEWILEAKLGPKSTKNGAKIDLKAHQKNDQKKMSKREAKELPEIPVKIKTGEGWSL